MSPVFGSNRATSRVILAGRRITPRGLNFCLAGLTARVADSRIVLHFLQHFPSDQATQLCLCVFFLSLGNPCLPSCLTSFIAPIWPVYLPEFEFIISFFIIFFKRKVRGKSRVKSPGSRERVGPLLSETFSLLPDVHQPSLLSFSPSFLSFFFFFAVVAGIRLSGRLYIAGHSGGDDLPWR